MGKTIVAEIKFEFDENVVNENSDTEMTEEELFDYAKQCFVDDIYGMVKYGELYDAVRVYIRERK